MAHGFVVEMTQTCRNYHVFNFPVACVEPDSMAGPCLNRDNVHVFKRSVYETEIAAPQEDSKHKNISKC